MQKMSMDQSVSILGLGLITPAVNDIAALAAACRGETVAPRQVASVPPPSGMSLRDQRRQAHLTRLALYAADRATDMAGCRGANGGIYVGLTHSTSAYLKEFLDYLYDYGPDMASPNAFSNGLANAPLGAVSLHHKLTQGGATMVGIESCGMEVLCHAASKVLDATHEICWAGATEEYSDLVDAVYRRVGWYGGERPPHLPAPGTAERSEGFGVSEGSVFFVLGPAREDSACLFTPVDDAAAFEGAVDLVVSGAGGGPHDGRELAALQELLPRLGGKVPLVFTKPFFGETFAVGPLLSAAVAWDILANAAAYPLYPVNPALGGLTLAGYDPGAVQRVLVVAASRDGQAACGLLSRPRP
jgi:3-oxoacyl-(acyl-carrier-protein) synthase